MSLVIPVLQAQLRHVAAAVMTGIHDVFLANEDVNGDDPISEKKLKQLEAQYATLKMLLGFHFDGINKTMRLESAKCKKITNYPPKAGFTQVIGGQQAYSSKNLSQRLQKYVTRSRASPWEPVSYPHATASLNGNSHLSTSIGTNDY